MLTNISICVTDRVIQMTNFFVWIKQAFVITMGRYNTIIFTACQRSEYLQRKITTMKQ